MSDQVDFRVIDPPAASFAPVAPNRLLLVSFILVAGIGTGAGMAFIASQLRPTFANVPTLFREIQNVEILGAVSTLPVERNWVNDIGPFIYFVGMIAALLSVYVYLVLNILLG